MRWRIPWAARAAVSVAVVAALLALLPLHELWRAIRAVPPTLLLETLALFLAGHAASAFKWRMLMTRRSEVPLGAILRGHFAGLMANLWLPSIAGGDVVRAAWVMRRTRRPEDVAVASVLDRAIDCLSLVLLAAAGAVWTTQLAGLAGRIVLVGSAALVLGAAAGALAYRVLARRAEDSLGNRLALSLRGLLRRPWLPLGSLAISLAVQSLFIVLSARLGTAAGVETGLGPWFVAWPLAKLTALLPVSLGGIGVREAALVAFMRPFGVSASAVAASGFLWDGVLATAGLLGGLVALAGGRERVRAAEEPPREPSVV